MPILFLDCASVWNDAIISVCQSLHKIAVLQNQVLNVLSQTKEFQRPFFFPYLKCLLFSTHFFHTCLFLFFLVVVFFLYFNFFVYSHKKKSYMIYQVYFLLLPVNSCHASEYIPMKWSQDKNNLFLKTCKQVPEIFQWC